MKNKEFLVLCGFDPSLWDSQMQQIIYDDLVGEIPKWITWMIKKTGYKFLFRLTNISISQLCYKEYYHGMEIVIPSSQEIIIVNPMGGKITWDTWVNNSRECFVNGKLWVKDDDFLMPEFFKLINGQSYE